MLVKSNFFVGTLVSVCFLCCVLFSSCLKSDSYSDQSQMLTFAIHGSDTIHTFVIDEGAKTISNITDKLPYGSNVTALIATFTVSDYAYVLARDSTNIDSTLYSIQGSTNSVNDYSYPVNFKVVSQSGSVSSEYVVTVYVSTTNPNEVDLKQTSSAINGNPANIQKVVWFKNQMWYFGADNQGGNTSLATSVDGINWTPKSLSINPSGVFNVAVYNDSLFLIDHSNVYVSGDGATWISRQNIAGIAPTYLLNDEDDHQLVAINGSQLYYTSDGNSWSSCRNDSAQMSNAGSTYHNGQLYLMGGRTVDGINNVAVADNASGMWNLLSTPYGVLIDPIVFSYSKRLWMIGGVTSTRQTCKDVRYSYDGGLTWKLDTLNEFKLPANYSRAGAQATVDSDGNIWLVGGYSIIGGSKTYYTDVLVGKMNTILN